MFGPDLVGYGRTRRARYHVTVFPIFPLGFLFVLAGVFGGDFLRVAQIFAGTRGNRTASYRTPLKNNVDADQIIFVVMSL